MVDLFASEANFDLDDSQALRTHGVAGFGNASRRFDAGRP